MINFILAFIDVIPNSSSYGNTFIHSHRRSDSLHLALLLLIGDVIKFGPLWQRPQGRDKRQRMMAPCRHFFRRGQSSLPLPPEKV